MNITETEAVMKAIAKICGCKDKGVSKVRYSFPDSYHSLCIDKRDVILAELEACEQLFKYAVDENDKNTLKREISELKMMLDLMH
jgi:hypothetical protein